MMADDIDGWLAYLAQLTDKLALCEEQYADAKQLAIPAMPPEVQANLERIDAACLPQMEELRRGIAEVQTQLKTAVLVYGRSVKGHGFHAVYGMGRVSWADDWLMGYAATHEEILQARKEGQPSVTLRKA